jgi:hypothetical protein
VRVFLERHEATQPRAAVLQGKRLVNSYVCWALRSVWCARSLQSVSRDDADDEDDAGLNAACECSGVMGESVSPAITPHSTAEGGCATAKHLVNSYFRRALRSVPCA